MYYVTVTIVLCSLPAGMGVIVDRLMLRRQKGRLHDALLRYWLHLEELNLPDIWRVFALYAIRFFTKVFGKKFLSFRCIITIILVSFCLTFCAVVGGSLLEYGHIDNIISPPLLLSIIYLFLNLVFDALTGLVTVKVLSVIHRSTPGKALVLIVIDVILAFIFAISCISFAVLLMESDRYDFLDIPYHFLGILLGRTTSTIINLSGFLYAGTTFIPTLIYLSILATLIISKVILGIGIRVTKFLLERATEVDTSKDLAVFTLTGSLFSVIVLLLTVFTKLCQTGR